MKKLFFSLFLFFSAAVATAAEGPALVSVQVDMSSGRPVLTNISIPAGDHDGIDVVFVYKNARVISDVYSVGKRMFLFVDGIATVEPPFLPLPPGAGDESIEAAGEDLKIISKAMCKTAGGVAECQYRFSESALISLSQDSMTFLQPNGELIGSLTRKTNNQQ